jgi:hypothetical protein
MMPMITMLNLFVIGLQGCSKIPFCVVAALHLLLVVTMFPPLSLLLISLYGLQSNLEHLMLEC